MGLCIYVSTVAIVAPNLNRWRLNALIYSLRELSIGLQIGKYRWTSDNFNLQADLAKDEFSEKTREHRENDIAEAGIK